MKRVLQHPFYLFGCVVALIATMLFSKNTLLPFLQNSNANGRMLFISAAMVAFFTVFTPIFTNSEYADGVIRNKMIAGYSQVQIYLSHLMTQLSAVFIMWALYMIGGLLGGAQSFSRILADNLVMLFAVCNYAATILALSFRIRKMIPLVISVTMVFNLCFNAVLFGNLLMMLAKESVVFFCSLLYNISALGQWFAVTGLADDCSNPGSVMQIVISLLIIAFVTLLGTLKLSKRDLV